MASRSKRQNTPHTVSDKAGRDPIFAAIARHEAALNKVLAVMPKDIPDRLADQHWNAGGLFKTAPQTIEGVRALGAHIAKHWTEFFKYHVNDDRLGHVFRSLARAGGDAGPDPIYAAIERHRAAYGKMDAAVSVRNRLERTGRDKRALKAAERKYDKAVDAENEAENAVHATYSTTAEGWAARCMYIRTRHYEDHGTIDADAQAAAGLRMAERMALSQARGPKSAEFRAVQKLVATIEAEVKARAARRRRWRKTAKAKRLFARTQEMKKGPTQGEYIERQKVLGAVRTYLDALAAAYEPKKRAKGGHP